MKKTLIIVSILIVLSICAVLGIWYFSNNNNENNLVATESDSNANNLESNENA
jgi:uncharacterized protein YxeA